MSLRLQVVILPTGRSWLDSCWPRRLRSCLLLGQLGTTVRCETFPIKQRLRLLTALTIDEDLAALTLLTNQPYYYLLYSFWSVQIVPIIVSLSIDIAAIAIPFALLRPLTHLHSVHAKTANQRLAQDWQIIFLTAALAASVYAVTFSLFYYFDLGVFLISHFDDIPSLETAHESNLPKMVTLFAASGFGAMLFLFRPTLSAAGKPSLIENKGKGRKVKKFNAETATLRETIAHNLGMDKQLSHRAEVLVKRATVLVACTVANTFVRIFGTIQGTDIAGSLGYAGLWATAHTLVVIVYAWLGNEQ